MFILNLFKQNIITLDEYLQLIVYLQNKVIEFSETAKTNEIEELIENIYIFMSCKSEHLTTSELWNNIVVSNIQNIITKKKEENKYAALTSRALFRCMDIIDLTK